MDTIFDRPGALRFIGLTQMLFGLLGLIAAIGLAITTWLGNPLLIAIGPLSIEIGYIYSALVFIGVALPCLVVGNYVDDLRRNAVIAQIFYSLIAVGLTAFFLSVFGNQYQWTFPWLEATFVIYIGNLATGILAIQGIFALYLIAKWKTVAPPSGTKIVRDRGDAGLIERGIIPSPLAAGLVGADGHSELTEDDTRRIMDVRKLSTDEGMAILCSNCGGATPISKVTRTNTVECGYCGVHLAMSGVVVPCENHQEFLAATTCSVCGDHFCRRCLTAQEPPIDERWEGSVIFLCQNCFEGRYQPAVTTTSLVIPIDELFGVAGGRFSKLGGLYKKFLGKYAGIMKYVLRFSLALVARMGRSGGGRSGGGRGNDAGAAILIIIVIIIAIPVLTFVAMLLAGIVIIPLLFYIGLVGVAIEAVKILRHTDFVTLDEAREKGITIRKPVVMRESTLRETTRGWQLPEAHPNTGPKKKWTLPRDDHERTDRFARR